MNYLGSKRFLTLELTDKEGAAVAVKEMIPTARKVLRHC